MRLSQAATSSKQGKRSLHALAVYAGCVTSGAWGTAVGVAVGGGGMGVMVGGGVAVASGGAVAVGGAGVREGKGVAVGCLGTGVAVAGKLAVSVLPQAANNDSKSNISVMDKRVILLPLYSIIFTLPQRAKHFLTG